MLKKKREGGCGENSIVRNEECVRRPEGKFFLDDLDLDGKLISKSITKTKRHITHAAVGTSYVHHFESTTKNIEA
jgi:hypothetical protein